jgi:murein L,D-transpeptidase YafK
VDLLHGNEIMHQLAVMVCGMILIAMAADWATLTPEERVADVKQRRATALTLELAKQGLSLGNATLLRVMKESSEMEVWMQPTEDAAYQLFKTYRIARWSGTLGPKLKEGDMQAPEGVYGITRRLMHPGSKYHLAMNIGYPNASDQALGRTGSLIMIHGSDVSVGCFAMTDPVIEELYLIVDAALTAGQAEVPVHSFPFRMTAERMAQTTESPWHSFWSELKILWDAFEQRKLLPAAP